MLFVAPLQNDQLWFPMLFALLVDFPPATTTVEAASFRSVSQPSHAGSSVHVELIEGTLQNQQFSDAVTWHLSQTVSASTASIYDCKWRVYESWCCTQQIN